MKVAVISDLHANIEALGAVLSAIDRIGANLTICLGDVVGYHASPNECIELLRARSIATVAGNHDRAAAGLIDPSDFGARAERAIRWTQQALTRENADYLASLPLMLSIDDFLAVHAGFHPRPNDRLHLSGAERVRRNLETLKQKHGAALGFVGHTHHPLAHEMAGRKIATHRLEALTLAPESTYIVNPGSVGQSRDRDPRASFLVYEHDRGKQHAVSEGEDSEGAERRVLRWYRIAYDAASCRAKAEEAGLCVDQPPSPAGAARPPAEALAPRRKSRTLAMWLAGRSSLA